jgi:hypothetical protein
MSGACAEKRAVSRPAQPDTAPRLLQRHPIVGVASKTADSGVRTAWESTQMRRSPTEVGLLVLPEACHAALGQWQDRVVNQRVTVNLDWWNTALAEHRPPGGPVVGVGVNGSTATGLAQIGRGDIFRLAHAVEDDEAALRLLWHTLAWGSGNKLRGNKRRLAAVAASPGQVAGLLRRAASLAGSQPGLAYTCLYPDDRRTAVPFLGPAFFTKYLYFAGGGAGGHLSVILDSRVATRLHDDVGWSSLDRRGGWPASTYERYCRLLGRWAAEVSDRQGQPVRADEIERWLFGPTAGPVSPSGNGQGLGKIDICPFRSCDAE